METLTGKGAIFEQVNATVKKTEFRPESSKAAYWAIHMHDSRLGDSDLDLLKGIRFVVALDLSGDFTDAAIAKLKSIDGLKRVILTSLPKVTDQGIDVLWEMPNLESVAVSLPQITDIGLRRLDELGSLESLGLQRAKITDNTLAVISRLPKLNALNLSNTPISDLGIARLVNLQHLELLSLSNTTLNADITNASLKQLRRLKNLKTLYLDNTAIDDNGLEYFGDYPNLQSLSFGSQEISDAGLRHLQGTKLKSLSVRGQAITDSAIPFLKNITTLEQLALFHTRVTANGIRQLESALPNLRITTLPRK